MVTPVVGHAGDQAGHGGGRNTGSRRGRGGGRSRGRGRGSASNSQSHGEHRLLVIGPCEFEEYMHLGWHLLTPGWVACV